MYNEKESAVKQPAHIEMAQKMVDEISTNYKPEDQNEILAFIFREVVKVRQDMIAQAEKHLCWLKDSYDQLANNLNK